MILHVSVFSALGKTQRTEISIKMLKLLIYLSANARRNKYLISTEYLLFDWLTIRR